MQVNGSHDNKVLELFWVLSNSNSVKRNQAVTSLYDSVKNFQLSNDAQNIDYILNRLIKGLNTVRALARLGFSSALTLVLSSMDTIQMQGTVFKKIEEFILKVKTETKEEECAAQLAKVFLLLALIKGESLVKLTSKQRCKIISHVVRLTAEPSLTDLSLYALSLCLSMLTQEEFQEIIFAKLEKEFQMGWENVSANHLLIMLKVHNIHKGAIDKNFLKTHYQCKKLLQEKNFDKILNCLFSSGQKREKSALHELAVFVLGELLSNPDQVSAFMQLAVSTYCSPTSPPQFKAVVFQMIFWLVQHLKTVPSEHWDSLLAVLFQQTVLSQIQVQLARSDSVLHTFTADLFSSSFLLNETITPEIKSAVFVIVSNYDDFHCFDMLVPGNCRFSQIFNQISEDILLQYSNSLKNEYKTLIKTIDKDNTTEIKKLNFLVLQLRILSSAKSFDSKAITNILMFFLDFSAFGSEDIPLSCRQTVQTCFFKCLDSLSNQKVSKKHNHYQVILSTVGKKVVERLEAGKSTLKPAVVKQISQSLASGLKLLENGSGDKLAWGFALVYLHMGFFMLSGEAKAFSEILQDIDECYKRANSQLKRRSSASSSDLLWSDVLVDSLINLLSHQSHLLRSVVKLVLVQIGHLISVKSVEVLVDLLLSSADAKADDEEEVIGFESDGENDDEVGEEGDEESVEDISSEESDDEEEDNTLDPMFRKSVKSALGDAAVQSDLEEDPSDMSDSAMERIDDALAMAFKARKRQTRKEVDQRRRTVIQMKFRCLDVVEVLLERCTDLQCRLKLLLGLLQFIQACNSGFLGLENEREQATGRCITLLNHFRKTKVQTESIQDSTSLQEDISEGIKTAFSLTQKAPCPAKMIDAAFFYFQDIYHLSPDGFTSSVLSHYKDQLTVSDNFKFHFNFTLSLKLFQAFPQVVFRLRRILFTGIESEKVKLFDKSSILHLLPTLFAHHNPIDQSQQLSESDAEKVKAYSVSLHQLVCGLVEKELKSLSSAKFLTEALSLLSVLMRYNPVLTFTDPIMTYLAEKHTEVKNADLRRAIKRCQSVLGSLKKEKLKLMNGHGNATPTPMETS